MPFGVSKDFLNLARDGQRRGLRALGLVLALVLMGAFVAEMLDAPRAGSFVLLYTISLALGLGLGALLGWLETRSWAESLRTSWNTWMESARGAGSMGEAAGRAGALHLARAGLLAPALTALNVSVLIAAWFTLPPFDATEPYGLLAMGTVVLTGLTLGAVLVLRLAEAWWCRSVEQQALELVREGRIGVWGVR